MQFEQCFRVVVEKIFNNWQNLRLAVEHGMGGRHGHKTAIEIMDYTYQYCIGNDKIAPAELQEVLEDLMDEEFNTICEDGSIREICHHLLHFKGMCLAGQYTEVEAELNKLPQKQEWLRPDVKIVPVRMPDDDDSLSEDDSSTENEETVQSAMDIDEMTAEKVVSDSSISKEDPEEFVEDPGWTTVRSTRKKR